MTTECIVCFEAFSPELMLTCANGHGMCSECAQGCVIAAAAALAEVNDIDTIAAASDDVDRMSGKLRCPCANITSCKCDAPVFSDAAIAKVVDEPTFSRYIEARTLLPIAQKSRKAFEEAHEALQSESRPGSSSDGNDASARGRRLLAKQLKSQMPDARQCAQCGFGPVDHFKCEDLAAHHGQVMANGVRIDNSCKRCGWFSADHADWPHWDGTLHDEVTTSAKEERDLSAQLLEAAEEAARAAQAARAKHEEQRRSAERSAESARLESEHARAELIKQRKSYEKEHLEKSKLEDQLADYKLKDKRRQREMQAAAVRGMFAERQGWSTLGEAAAAPMAVAGARRATTPPQSETPRTTSSSSRPDWRCDIRSEATAPRSTPSSSPQLDYTAIVRGDGGGDAPPRTPSSSSRLDWRSDIRGEATPRQERQPPASYVTTSSIPKPANVEGAAALPPPARPRSARPCHLIKSGARPPAPWYVSHGHPSTKGVLPPLMR